jgi:hypothetical protein
MPLKQMRVASIVLVLVGVGEVLAGSALTAMPAPHLAPAQRTLDEIRAFSPPVANWVLHASLDETWGLTLVGFATLMIAWNAYPRRERWAWYSLAVLTVGYNVGSILIHVLTIDAAILNRDPAYWSLYLGLFASLLALIVSMSDFFGSGRRA